MNATARFVHPLRPDSVRVLSCGYLAAAIWCADLVAAALPPRPRKATVHRLQPKVQPPRPALRPAAILPFAHAALR
ncbi:hypothetical protein [Methylobacterium sp. ID0610]|uniref:hypothetical protein n=1 Tax=Methylobacterium carpenticola TaxID=3344827 RepID=UPI00367FB6E7